MKIEKFFDLGKFLGSCKIWTISFTISESPFYQPMPSPLNALKNKLEHLEIQEETIK